MTAERLTFNVTMVCDEPL